MDKVVIKKAETIDFNPAEDNKDVWEVFNDFLKPAFLQLGYEAYTRDDDNNYIYFYLINSRDNSKSAVTEVSKQELFTMSPTSDSFELARFIVENMESTFTLPKKNKRVDRNGYWDIQ